MRMKTRNWLASLLTVVAVLASSLVAASPAQAAVDSAPFAQVRLSNCSLVNDYYGNRFNFYRYQGGCRDNDSVDYTFFRPDSGGVGVKIMLFNNGVMTGKVEFHPYGEYLWIYDTRNDGDTYYVRLEFEWPDGTQGYYGPVRPPGTSDPVDVGVFDRSYPEGTRVDVRVYDTSSQSSFIQHALGTA